MRKYFVMAAMAACVMGTASCSSSGDSDDDLINVVPGNPSDNGGNDNKPETYVIEGGQVEGTWKKGSTYTVKGSFEIPAGKSLTIEDGVTVIMEKNESVPVEIMVYGDLYCMGKEDSEISFTISDEQKKVAAAEDNKRVWGGIFGADGQKVAPNLVFQYTNFEYTGALTTNNSYSAHTFKSTVGKGVPAINTMDQRTNLVIQHCNFRNNGQDALYMQGGNMIISNNVFEGQGDVSGAEGVNFKSGVVLDLAYNLFYSPANSAAKLSGTTDMRTPGDFTLYNNTVINGGGRKKNAAFGCFAVEMGCSSYIYNNLMANCKWGILDNVADPAKLTEASNNFYYAYNQADVDRFQSSLADDGQNGIVKGETNSVKGTKAGENDPQFVSYILSTPTTTAAIPDGSDFHLKASSPALKAGAEASVVAKRIHFLTNGLTINGVTYKSPAASPYCGAFGAN